MHSHNLEQKDYNFEGVFWNYQTILIMFEAIGGIIFYIMNGVYFIAGIEGFICYIVGLFKEKLCPITFSIY